jgi:hypothetical protein
MSPKSRSIFAGLQNRKARLPDDTPAQSFLFSPGVGEDTVGQADSHLCSTRCPPTRPKRRRSYWSRILTYGLVYSGLAAAIGLMGGWNSLLIIIFGVVQPGMQTVLRGPIEFRGAPEKVRT